MGNSITANQRKLCSQIAIKQFNITLEKYLQCRKADAAATTYEHAESRSSLPEQLPDALRSKLRYIAGASVAKLKWRHSK